MSQGISDFCRRRALELYPQLERAVPPKDIGPRRGNPLRVGSFPFTVCNYFWNDHQRQHTVRKANDAAAVIGPVRLDGWCLHPLRTDGGEAFFDPTLPAQHGDIVLFQFDPDVSAASSANELRFMSKMLVEFAGEYWLAFREGMFPLGDIRILGVEVAKPSIVCREQAPVAVEGVAR